MTKTPALLRGMSWYARHGWPAWTRRSMQRKIARRYDGLEGETILANGMRMSYRIGDPVDTSMVVQGTFEPRMTEIVSGLAPSHGAFVDVGCNIGYFTCLYAKANPAARILALDANPAMVERCRGNLQRNGFDRAGLVQVVNAGVSDKREVLTLVLNEKRPSLASFGNERGAESRTIAVGMKPISELLDEHALAAPAVFKIDIEGYEPAFFAGLSTAHALATRHFFFEYARSHMQKCGFDHRRIWECGWWDRFQFRFIDETRVSEITIPEIIAGNYDGMIWARARQ